MGDEDDSAEEYHCEKECGFSGDFDTVVKHEAGCTFTADAAHECENDCGFSGGYGEVVKHEAGCTFTADVEHSSEARTCFGGLAVGCPVPSSLPPSSSLRPPPSRLLPSHLRMRCFCQKQKQKLHELHQTDESTGSLSARCGPRPQSGAALRSSLELSSSPVGLSKLAPLALHRVHAESAPARSRQSARRSSPAASGSARCALLPPRSSQHRQPSSEAHQPAAPSLMVTREVIDFRGAGAWEGRGGEGRRGEEEGEGVSTERGEGEEEEGVEFVAGCTLTLLLPCAAAGPGDGPHQHTGRDDHSRAVHADDDFAL